MNILKNNLLPLFEVATFRMQIVERDMNILRLKDWNFVHYRVFLETLKRFIDAIAMVQCHRHTMKVETSQ